MIALRSSSPLAPRAILATRSRSKGQRQLLSGAIGKIVEAMLMIEANSNLTK